MLNQVKNAISKYIRIILACAAVILIVISFRPKAPDTKSIAAATVMVKSLSGGGGTGVIISHGANESQVLTNNHVCEVIQDGGTVTTISNEVFLITSYAPSLLHDVCMLYIQKDLGASVEVASSAPALYSAAIISGHPNLLPNVITKGHFADSQIISVFMGMRACTRDEASNGETGMVCMFFGGMPILKQFNTILVTATIMAGSSGSAVYNEKNEVAGLVFAGSGELSYAYIVPYAYVSYFVNKEDKRIKSINYEIDLGKAMSMQGKTKTFYKEILAKCGESSLDPNIEKYCNAIVRDMSFRSSLWK